MVISTRHLLLGLCVTGFILGAAMWIFMASRTLGTVTMGCSLICSVLLISAMRSTSQASYSKEQNMSDLPKQRQHELLRGTSQHLHKMKYRYSVRIDHNQTVDRCCFNADVNTIKLGFVPVVITDNATDKQGYGFVAFVYDGKRWLGPGLPCPGTREQAIAHAQRSVDPLEDAADSDQALSD